MQTVSAVPQCYMLEGFWRHMCLFNQVLWYASCMGNCGGSAAGQINNL